MDKHPSAEAAMTAVPEVSPFVGNLSSANLALLSLAMASILVVVVLYTFGYSKSRGNALLLVGPPESGKTAILSNLAYNQTLPSHTSLQTNSAQMTLSPSKTMRVIDVPGHPRIRNQFREHLKDTTIVAFIVDCSTISRNGSVVAEYLHCVLHAMTSLPPTQTAPALVVVAHKTDLLKVGASSSTAGEVGVARVRSILERELEKRRASQSGGVGVESLGGEGEGELGGLECSGDTFRFSEWEGGEVAFVSTWVGKEEDGLGELKDSLLKVM